MFVSIIIPTYNRSHLIGITLESLIHQTYPKDKFEIIVVNNHSTDNTASIVHEWELNSNGLVKYYFESRQGSHFARNGVVKYAKGDLLYFTDDDMIADENLLVELVGVFKNEQVGSATGRVLPHWEIEPPKWIKKYCTNGWLSLYDMKDELFISDDDFGVFSCHQAVKKDVFVKAGGYNPDIVNGEWLGDNETGLNLKIKSLGYKFAFVRSSITNHIIPPTRMTQSYLNKRFGNQGNCDSYTEYRKYRFSNEQLKRNIKNDRLKMLVKFVKFIFTRLICNDKWHIHRASINYFSNKIKYNKRLIFEKKWVKMVLINDWINQ